MFQDMTDTLNLASLGLELDVPPTTGVIECQGDIYFIPWDETIASEERKKIVTEAEPLVAPTTIVQGRGGNSHVLVNPDCNPNVLVYRYKAGSQTWGAIVVPEGGYVCIDHRQHGRNTIGEGVYVIRRQRVMLDKIKKVED